ncbi:MAG TPA: hypothetical protein K8V21_07895 [Weissella thailandensis]|uniref:hypothetical protein n=1 Tax=Weissella thailandensis TaxID=89061 RepID=UPI001D65810F|nr:hypothetical protein [Weissella thailandensis]HJG85287.1 hypothetical protein [Weissella thailandensis]
MKRHIRNHVHLHNNSKQTLADFYRSASIVLSCFVFIVLWLKFTLVIGLIGLIVLLLLFGIPDMHGIYCSIGSPNLPLLYHKPKMMISSIRILKDTNEYFSRFIVQNSHDFAQCNDVELPLIEVILLDNQQGVLRIENKGIGHLMDHQKEINHLMGMLYGNWSIVSSSISKSGNFYELKLYWLV